MITWAIRSLVAGAIAAAIAIGAAEYYQPAHDWPWLLLLVSGSFALGWRLR